jgi:hypothetical protein
MSNPQGGIPQGTFPDGPPSDSPPISDGTMIELVGTAQSITVDGQTTSERSVDELIKLDQYLRNRKANSNGWGSIGRARAIPPSASGRDAC